MALTFQVESIRTIRDEAAGLLHAHWEEVALDRESVPLDPDWSIYEQIEDAGKLHVVTARDGAALVGYSIYFLTISLHYRSVYVAESDVFFLSRDRRGARAGKRMMQFAEETLREKGVNKIVTRTKLHHDLGSFLEHMGYRAVERVYWKNLG